MSAMDTVRPVPGAGRRLQYSAFEYVANFIRTEFKATEAPSYAHAGNNFLLRAYMNSKFASVNEDLRFGDRLEDDSQQVTEGLLKLMKPLEKPQMLYRGIPGDVFEEEDIGTVFDIDSFMSTSRDPRVAFNFSRHKLIDDEIGTILELSVDGSTYGITTANGDTQMSEDETILEYGQKMRIDSVELRMVPGAPMHEGNRQVMYVKASVWSD